ncbi:MAG TPA: outer membrane protein assembly factor BamA [Rhizomicrobium sp.]|jgi:outer membrane protein insertion porin family|nr:outer membrane protein assembly factor BamA [Rhizomicrobium sp.]
MSNGRRGMRTISNYKAVLRATSATLCLAMFAAPAAAQLRPGADARAQELNAQRTNPQAPAATPQTPAQPQRVIQRITVSGTQRVEPGTVLTYVNIREGDAYDPANVDTALKALFGTGLFSDVKINFNNGTLAIQVVENPILNQVVFEGNDKVSTKDLTKEVQIKPRETFTRARVEADIQRIIELYRRNGKFAARVDPQIIQRPQNRVDLIFSITEGPTTGIARINFIGNKVYDASALKGQIATEESAWYKFLASNDNYDPDRLAFDREQLRRFYVNHGYADFTVVSAVAQLGQNRRDFYVTFTVNEGPRYRIGKVEINSKIKELMPQALRPMVPIKSGEIYDADSVQKAIDALTNAAGTKGYAFAEVHPRIARNRNNNTIDLIFDIEQGPRVYIGKINIVGNTRTLDKVIRREFRLVEGDAFNRVLMDRSRSRIRGLGFFKDVEVKNTPGSAPDRTDVTVNVTEQSTGQLQLGVGYSSVQQLTGEFSYTEQNLFGRGQYLKASLSISQIAKLYQLSFTEPYFLDRPLAAGFDLYESQTDYIQATYSSDQIGAVVRTTFPISEYSTVQLRYSYQINYIYPFSGAPLEVLLAQGRTYGSILGFTYGFSNLDDVLKPTTGEAFSFTQGFAGFGGNLRYLKSDAVFSGYRPAFGGAVIASLTLRAGIIQSYDGSILPINQRYFDGGDTFRGFALAGIGPRDLDSPVNTGALGGDAHAIGTFQARLPSLLPESYGVSLGLFTDFGTLGQVQNVQRACTVSSCVVDNFAFRASAGISLGWRSPFGPLQIDLGLPYVKTYYDRPQILHFSAGTGF